MTGETSEQARHRMPMNDWSTNVLVVETEIEKLYIDAQRGITKAETHLCM